MSRRGGAVRGGLAVAALAALLPGATGVAGEADDVGVVSASAVDVSSRVATPYLAPVAARRIDARLDSRLTGTSLAGGRTLAIPASMGGPVTEQTVPYRVEPKGPDGRPGDPWDLPPEVPDARDFERVETFDTLASPHYEIREEIWNNPEDLVTQTGMSRYGGIAYVPFWGRNTLRWGRFSLFPFAHVEGVWHSSMGEGEGDGESVYEFLASAGALGEYWFAGGKTKLKASIRADYRWYDSLYDTATTYVGGAAVETKLSPYHTVEIGGEMERARRAFDLDTTLGDRENLFQRESVYVNGRWDRFLCDDLRLEAGASYAWLDELDSEINGGDYTSLDAWVRLGMAVMRHESFAYVEGRYEERDADEETDSSDLDHAYEVRVGVNGIQPHARTRRVVGNVYAGWRTEQYTAAQGSGSVGAGQDDEVDLLTLGADLTYRPTAYTSGFLSFQRTNTFSAVANFNTVDSLTLAVTQNLSRRVVGRVSGSVTRIEPEDRSSSWRYSLGAGVRWVLTDNVDASADYEYSHRLEGAGFSDADAHRVAVGMTFHLR